MKRNLLEKLTVKQLTNLALKFNANIKEGTYTIKTKTKLIDVLCKELSYNQIKSFNN